MVPTNVMMIVNVMELEYVFLLEFALIVLTLLRNSQVSMMFPCAHLATNHAKDVLVPPILTVQHVKTMKFY